MRVPYLDASGQWVFDAIDSDDGDNDGAGDDGTVARFAPRRGAGAGGTGAAPAAYGFEGADDGDAYFAPQPLLGDRDAAGDDENDNGGAGNGGRGSSRRPRRLSGIHGALHERALSLGSLLQAYMERVHAPLLMRPAVQAGVAVVFITALFLSAAAIPRLEVGLDQAVALPRDSYLQGYYKSLYASLRVGPPLYFVVEGLDLSAAPAASPNGTGGSGGGGGIDAVCSVAGCRPDSLGSRVARAALEPGRTYIAAPAASWADDFLSWLSPSLPKCCRRHAAGAASPFANATGGSARCPPPDQAPCSANATVCSDCGVCYSELPGGRPTLAGYQEYLPWFLEAAPSEACAKGGAGVYSSSVKRDAADATGVAGLSRGEVAAAALRTFNTPLNGQGAFIGALAAAREFADAASRELGLKVYPYSVFHVFFEQYLTPARWGVVGGGEEVEMGGGVA